MNCPRCGDEIESDFYCIACGYVPPASVEVQVKVEKIWRLIAERLPRSLVYWCAMRVIVFATTGKYSNQKVPELTAMDALERWRSN